MSAARSRRCWCRERCTSMRIRLGVDGARLVATLDDNDTAEAWCRRDVRLLRAITPSQRADNTESGRAPGAAIPERRWPPVRLQLSPSPAIAVDGPSPELHRGELPLSERPSLRRDHP